MPPNIFLNASQHTAFNHYETPKNLKASIFLLKWDHIPPKTLLIKNDNGERATQQPTTPTSIVRIFNPLSHFGRAMTLYNLNKTIQILYVTFSLPIQIKRQTTWQLFVYFVDKATKREIVSSYPKAKTRVHPRHDFRNSDGTPFWIQNDDTRPMNPISSTFTKNWLQHRNFHTIAL